MRSLISSILFLLPSVFGLAQEQRCITSEKMHEQLLLDPSLAERRAAIEEFTQRWNTDNGAEREVISIPVVVHVVYRTETENISDEHIYSQLQVLNEDYRMTNADAANVPSVWDGVKADTEIEFCLAVRDPNGFPTTGITRTLTTVTNWNGSDNVKRSNQGGKDPWSVTKYLNIWVCNIGSGLLGFAYQPGVAASLDGLVIGYRYFGRDVPGLSSTYSKGRTSTHEIGHYFNLDHPWGTGASNPNCNQSDFVNDTPVQDEPNYGCQTFPHVTCDNGPNGDMFNNYMDYGDDDCLFFFTSGQKQRMLAALNGPRSSLKTSLGCVPTNVGIDEVSLSKRLSVYPNPADNLIHIAMENAMDRTFDVRMLNLMGAEVLLVRALDLNNASIAIDHLPSGLYILEVNTPTERASHRIHIIR
ncbi:MAG: T9SS type A sorting domain-containing protein [Flavobacteriales bacterium]|nr:T9SS type A sorting domain-containing protein [Flavobacteriales bacterium]